MPIFLYKLRFAKQRCGLRAESDHMDRRVVALDSTPVSAFSVGSVVKAALNAKEHQ